MFFKYSFLSLSLALSFFSVTHSLIDIDHLPQKHQEFLLAILHGNNAYAENSLRENPEININMATPDEGIPYTTLACYDTNNNDMLKVLIDKGLDTSNFGYTLYWAIKQQINLRLNAFKVLVEQGALKQLTRE